MKRRLPILVLLLWLLAGENSLAEDWPARYHFVSFPDYEGELQLAARLSFPASGQGPFPAVVIAHGSGGVDSRGPAYAQALNARGIATLELDMWAARGLKGGLDRPAHVRETLGDAYGALRYLKDRPDIDGKRIGLMGFSWGGVMAMLVAAGTDRPEAGPGFSAAVALYPVCWGYNRVPGYRFARISTGPLLIIEGDKDDYDGARDCENLLQGLPEDSRQQVTLRTLPDATHAFDRKAPEALFYDPYAFRGEGGKVRLRYSPGKTHRSKQLVTGFFMQVLNAPQTAGR